MRYRTLIPPILICLAVPAGTLLAADEPAKDKAKEAWEQVKSGAAKAGHEIKEASKDAGQAIAEGSKKFGHEVAEGSKAAGNDLADASKQVGQEIADGAKQLWGDTKAFFSPRMRELDKAVRGFWSRSVDEKDRVIDRLKAENEALKKKLADKEQQK